MVAMKKPKLEWTVDLMKQYLKEEVCSEEFIDGAVCIGGYNKDTMEDILYYHTGYSDFDDWYADNWNWED